MDQNKERSIRSTVALLVGTDQILLYTRKAILEKEGFRVSTMDPVHAVHNLREASPDVIIACHTLTIPEADDLVRAARAESPAPALVGFSKELAPAPTSYPFDATVWSLASPESFVNEVHAVLLKRAN